LGFRSKTCGTFRIMCGPVCLCQFNLQIQIRVEYVAYSFSSNQFDFIEDLSHKTNEFGVVPLGNK